MTDHTIGEWNEHGMNDDFVFISCLVKWWEGVKVKDSHGRGMHLLSLRCNFNVD